MLHNNFHPEKQSNDKITITFIHKLEILILQKVRVPHARANAVLAPSNIL